MKINTSFLLCGILILSMSILTSSCKKKYELENAKLDTLQLHLSSTREFLNLDIQLFEFRMKQIEERMLFIESNLSDTVDLDFGNNMTRYKAILKIYRKYTTAYNDLSKEYEELEKQVNDLRTSLNRGEFTREEFKEYYYTEERDIISLRESAKGMKNSLYSVEPDYNRLTDFALEQIHLIDSINGTVAD